MLKCIFGEVATTFLSGRAGSKAGCSVEAQLSNHQIQIIGMVARRRARRSWNCANPNRARRPGCVSASPDGDRTAAGGNASVTGLTSPCSPAQQSPERKEFGKTPSKSGRTAGQKFPCCQLILSSKVGEGLNEIDNPPAKPHVESHECPD